MQAMWNEYDSRIPWIFWTYAEGGGFLVHDSRSNATIFCADESCIHQFAADHSSNGRGLGDLFHKIAQKLGFSRCDECAKRQVTGNVWTPWS
jgi:hypothetical protein